MRFDDTKEEEEEDFILCDTVLLWITFTSYFMILFCYESLLLHTLWYCFVMNHFYFILCDTVLLWITFTLYFVLLFCYESLLLYTLLYCFFMNHFYFILCDTVLLWITFTSSFVILFCYERIFCLLGWRSQVNGMTRSVFLMAPMWILSITFCVWRLYVKE